MTITSIRLSEDIEKPLDSLAAKLDRSKNYLINQAIKEFIDKQSVADARWDETLAALDSVQSGQYIDEIQVNDWLNSLGTNQQKTRPDANR